MKLVINEDEKFCETEIIINCNKIDEKLLKLIGTLKAHDDKIKGSKNSSIFLIDLDNILYFESVDKKTFIYTTKDVYETSLRLYEIEEKYRGGDFFRASKSTIINLSKINRINPMFGGKLEVVLENKERLMVSRQYVKELKIKLDY